MKIKSLLLDRLKRGSILIILLWILTFLFFIGVEIQLLVQRTRELILFEKHQMISKVASLSGLEYAKFLLTSDQKESDSLNEKWAYQAFKKFPLGKESSFNLINKSQKKNTEFHFGLKDLESKLALSLIPVDRWPSILKLKEGQSISLSNFGENVLKFEDLLQLSSIIGLDVAQMMGEDQNDDGLLNENENDGDQSLPLDNFDDLLQLGIADMVSWQSDLMNINTIGAQQLSLLYPSKKSEIDRFISLRSQKEEAYTTIPNEFHALFKPQKWFGVSSRYFVVRSIGQYKESFSTNKYLVYRDEDEVYTLRPLIW